MSAMAKRRKHTGGKQPKSLRDRLLLLLAGLSVFVLLLMGLWWWQMRNLERNYGDERARDGLHSIARIQLAFHEAKARDLDGDGVGEFGWMGELSGVEALPGGLKYRHTPNYGAELLRFKRPDGWSRIRRGIGRICLPGPGGTWIGEPPPPPAPEPDAEDDEGTPPAPATAPPAAVIDARESRWLCYGIPTEYGDGRFRALVISADGLVWYSEDDDAPYDAANPPAPDAALNAAGAAIADGDQGEKGRDGRFWYRYK